MQGIQLLRSEKGSSEPIAFIALIPFVLLVILALVQVALFGYAAVATEAAARDAARAASLGDNPYTEVRQVSQATGVRMSAIAACDPSTQTVRVSVKALPMKVVPVVSADLLAINRQVDQRMEVACPP